MSFSSCWNETKFPCSRDVFQRFLCFMPALHGTLHFVIRSLIRTREIISDRSKAKIVVSGVAISTFNFDEGEIKGTEYYEEVSWKL